MECKYAEAYAKIEELATEAYFIRYSSYYEGFLRELDPIANKSGVRHTMRTAVGSDPGLLQFLELPWRRILAILKAEEEDSRQSPSLPEGPMTSLVSRVALRKLGMKYAQIRACIELYLNQDQLSHKRKLNILMASRNWAELAKLLSNDLSDLKTAPRACERHVFFTRLVINAFASIYFQNFDQT